MYGEAKKIFEEKICYIAKNSIKSGIYLVMATQKVFENTITKKFKNMFFSKYLLIYHHKKIVDYLSIMMERFIY